MATRKKESVNIKTGTGEKLEIPVYRYKNSTRLTLAVKPNGTVRISAPYGISLRELTSFSKSRLNELENALKKIGQQAIILPDTIVWPPDNQAYTVEQHWDALTAGTLLTVNDHSIRIRGRAGEQKLAVIALQKFFRAKAKIFLPCFISSLAPEIPFRVRVGNQQRNMGSCSRRKDGSQVQKRLPTICLNWRASFLEPAMLEHLCWHELAHIEHMNHSADFYRQLEAFSPGCKTREKELTRAWGALPGWILYHD